MSNLIVGQTTFGRAADDSYVPGRANRLGLQVVQDFYTYAALMGAGFQVRAGTLTTPLVGDVVITDTAAEMCVDASSAMTVIPVRLGIAVRLATGTLHEYAMKSVGVVSSAGTAFVPLPLLMGGTAAVSTARVAAAGGVTVTAELATTTRRHWEYSNPVAAGAGNDVNVLEFEPRMPPIIKGAGCLYIQIAATGTGPSYVASLDYLEFASAVLF